MGKPLFIGNWKMHFLPHEAEEYIASFQQTLDNELIDNCDIALAPPFPLLPLVGASLSHGRGVRLAAQNVHWENSGAHTGEVSPALLSALGVTYVLVGHSERRQFYGESDQAVAKRVRAAAESGLRPVLCVGETEEEYRSGASKDATLRQLQAGISELSSESASSLVVAYEPVWAIGTGLAATPEHAQQQHSLIRSLLVQQFGEQGQAVPLLYGGSTKPENMEELAQVENVDGALPGGSSLKPQVFAELIRNGLKGYRSKTR